MEHQGFIDSNKSVYDLIAYLENIPLLNKKYLEAIKEVVKYNDYLKENQVLINNESKHNKQIQEYASFLYNRYNFRYYVVGTLESYDKYYHEVKTPYGNFT
jgi:hypothetical protein